MLVNNTFGSLSGVRDKEVRIKHISALRSLQKRAWVGTRQDHSPDLLHILGQWSTLPSCSAPALRFHFRQAFLPATTGCQRPEAYLTALLCALQATGLSDCCNMLHISPGTHTEYNHWRPPHPSLAMPHPRSLLLRWNERCAICHGVWLHTRPGK